MYLLVSGHCQLLQVSTSSSQPGHWEPPFLGTGREHERRLRLMPEPQVAEHLPHDPHSLHPPSTGKAVYAVEIWSGTLLNKVQYCIHSMNKQLKIFGMNNQYLMIVAFSNLNIMCQQFGLWVYLELDTIKLDAVYHISCGVKLSYN